MSGGISRHIPYSQRGRCGTSSNIENIELKVSRILKDHPNAQNNDYHNPAAINGQQAQNTLDEANFLCREQAVVSPICNVRSLQGNLGYRGGHFSI